MDLHRLYSYFAMLKLLPHEPAVTVYKYVGLETAKTILRDSTLYYQTPEKFNDPFELHLGFRHDLLWH